MQVMSRADARDGVRGVARARPRGDAKAHSAAGARDVRARVRRARRGSRARGRSTRKKSAIRSVRSSSSNGTTLGKEEIERAAIGRAAALGFDAGSSRSFGNAFSRRTEPNVHHNGQQHQHCRKRSVSSAWVRPGYRLVLWQHGRDNGRAVDDVMAGYTDLRAWMWQIKRAGLKCIERRLVTLFHHDKGYGRWWDAWEVDRNYYSSDMGGGSWA